MARGGAAGGSLALVELITQHGEPLEADLQRYYNLDLRRVFDRPARAAPSPLRDRFAHWWGPPAAGAVVGVFVGALVWAPLAALAVAIVVAAVCLAARRAPRSTRAPQGYQLTPRRVLALVRHLPHESATVAAMRGGDQFRGWDADRYLLALIGDLLQNLIHVQVAKANPKRKPPKPEPIPRPSARQPTAGAPAGDGQAATGAAHANPFAAMVHARLEAQRSKKGG